MTVSYGEPTYLGSGEVKGRYEQPKPLPWYYTNQTAVTWWAFMTAALLIGVALCLS